MSTPQDPNAGQYGPPPGQYGPPPGQYGPPPVPGMYPLPPGVVLAPRGRRVGAYFLAFVLSIVTLGIGYLIWGLIVWGKGTSPALQVLGMKVWRLDANQPATFGTMALRDIIGVFVQGILGPITALISFIMFLTGDRQQTLPDRIASTTVVHDPGKVLA